MLLRFSRVDVFYGKAQALDEVTIEVEEGQIVVIVGSNGAGKTTTLKSIANLVKIRGGEIWFDGKRINGMPPEKMTEAGISICMEGRRVFPFMTVLENIEMGAFRRRDKGGIAQDCRLVFERFPILEQRQKQKAGTLSGGEQQMLAVARALMAKPRLLLLDEPSMGLAPLVITKVTEAVKDLNKTGLTILLVEQNAEMALALAQKGYVLEVGRITMEGDSKTLHDDSYIREAYLGI